MSKLTAGDCVAVLGRQWAESECIRTTADMAKPATKEQQKLAEWASSVTKPKANVNAYEPNTELKVVRKSMTRRMKKPN